MTLPDQPQPNIPNPDPSKLTREIVEQGTAQSRHELDQEVKLLNYRIDRIRIDLDAVPELHDASLKHLADLFEEKVRGVCQSIAALETRFTDANTAHDARSKLIQDKNQEALNISFTAQEKLNTVVTEGFKSEIARVAATTNEQIKSLEAQLTAMKERIDKNEGTIAGDTAAQITARANLTAQLAQVNNSQGAQGLKISETGKWIAIAATVVSFAVLISGIVISLIVHTGK